nr:MAG TPA: ATP synthase [Caudoviricetes sp.]
MEQFTALISSFGFPVACVCALGYFIWYFFKQTKEESQQRENNLMDFLKRSQEINAEFAEIIAKYEVKLDEIQKDIEDIKEDTGELVLKA